MRPICPSASKPRGQMGFYAAALVDAGSPMASKIGSISKCYSTDMLQKVVSDAVQIFGGYGYSREYPLEKLMRDAKIFQDFRGDQPDPAYRS